MSKIIDSIEQEQLKQDLPDFDAGDTVMVQVRIRESDRADSYTHLTLPTNREV